MGFCISILGTFSKFGDDFLSFEKKNEFLFGGSDDFFSGDDRIPCEGMKNPTTWNPKHRSNCS